MALAAIATAQIRRRLPGPRGVMASAAARGLVVASAILLTTAPNVAGEFATNAAHVAIDGVKGNQGIRTDPAHVAGVIYAHPIQIDTGASGGDFVAVGTYKGAATNVGEIADCPSDYDGGWTGYVDGIVGGLYFCYTFGADAYGAGEISAFEIYYTACGPDGVKKWALSYGGTLRRCVSSASSTAQWAIVGLETVGSTADRNIDVRYSALKVNRDNGTTWVETTWQPAHVDPNYSTRINSNAQNDAYLAPWD